jgi:hypothetical protein
MACRSQEDERAARQSRGAMRDQLMALAGLEGVAFDVYDVRGHEYIAGGATAGS